jgi:hypothetical protein
LIVFLEDRRVLFDDFAVEIPEAVFQSILEIRAELTRTLQELPEGASAGPTLRRMRGACSSFLSGPGSEAGFGYGFWLGLGQLRGYIGDDVAALAHGYGIDVHGPLERILAPTLEDDAALRTQTFEFRPPRRLYVEPPEDLPPGEGRSE